MTNETNQPSPSGQPADKPGDPLNVDPEVEAGRLEEAAQEAADAELADAPGGKPAATPPLPERA